MFSAWQELLARTSFHDPEQVIIAAAKSSNFSE